MSRQRKIDNRWRWLRGLYDAFGFPHEYHVAPRAPRPQNRRDLRRAAIDLLLTDDTPNGSAHHLTSDQRLDAFDCLWDNLSDERKQQIARW